ncbi:hypothetical protein GCM10009804_52630 [Kribbella hippodromi]|uniref:Uncharacterized protein n=1 Tax=Kribbella hippodromi TaxID=434347 RepID=A0ABP4PT95_9ACTN
MTVNRKALRALLLPGQERLHFNNETDARRKKILRTISDFHLLVDIYHAPRETFTSRKRCLEAIVRDTAGDAERLVIERDDSTYDRERGTLHSACQRFGCFDLHWDLLAPKLDPLLWVPDAVAAAWTRGGHWRRLVQAYSQPKDL